MTMMDLRKKYKSEKTPLFMFTILREPISYMISAYNFHCVHLKIDGCQMDTVTPNNTALNFLKVSRRNPQASWLEHNWGPWFGINMFDATKEPYRYTGTMFDTKDNVEININKTISNMINLFDYVGDTFRMNETYNALRAYGVMAGHDVQTHKTPVLPRNVKLSMLNETGLKELREIVALDLELYRRVKKVFPNGYNSYR